jgi:two-component system OmpR family sensor kinase
MVKTLRARLLASYVTILLIMLPLIGLALLVFLRSRPLPTGEIISNLTATLLDVRTHATAQLSMGQDAFIEQWAITYLESEAATRDVRLLVVNNNGLIRLDSNNTLAEGSYLDEIERSPLIKPPPNRPNILVFEGRFRDPNGRVWIFVSQPLRGRQMIQSDTAFLLVAQPAPRPTLREVFRVFGNTFFSPLARAGILALLVAIALSAVIAQSVAHPLQQMGHAARRIAAGDLDQRVPVQGPREVQALVQSFNDMVERVAIGQQAQRDFLANVSHDLRTPLTSIQGFSQAIVDGVASDPESAQRAAQIIQDEAARMRRMVEELLDLARIEAGKLDMRRRAVRVGDVLQTVADSLSVRAQEKGLRLEATIPPALPRIAGDEDRLVQVFSNLLDNAINHTPPGGLVSLDAEANQGGIVIAIRDTGEGIPPDDLPRIFERFYQVDKSRQRSQQPGIGLGLAITRQIVEAHGGTIQAASALGKGTIFTVWLPLPAPDAPTVSSRR